MNASSEQAGISKAEALIILGRAENDDEFDTGVLACRHPSFHGPIERLSHVVEIQGAPIEVPVPLLPN
jgi:hypothetical protein